MQFSIGMTIRARGERFSVVDVTTFSTGPEPLTRLSLRGLGEDRPTTELAILYPVDDVEPDEIPDLSITCPGRLARFRLLHDVFQAQAAPPTDMLVGVSRSRIRPEPYQYVPSTRALELPRPRLLLADDVGLGKTIEAGLILQDLAARRRANRVLIVCPAGIMQQWQQELEMKFGQKFAIFDRDEVHAVRLRSEIGVNPWASVPRVIASMDFVKRREGPFRELSSTKWDVVIVDEAHHIASGRGEDVTDRHRLGQWLSDASDALLLLTATPHDGYDESFSSLLGLLEPSLVMPGGRTSIERYRRHLVRRLKRHIRNPDGTEKFLERTVTPLAVQLTDEERSLHLAVSAQARDLEEVAESLGRRPEAEAFRFVATVLKKRAASSRAALTSTVQTRRENLDAQIEELEVQRDHVRALRRGETIPDEALARLERDAHRSYLAAIRRLGREVRRSEAEHESLGQLETLLEACQDQADSKITHLVGALEVIHQDEPTDKVIIFSEYVDTVAAIVESLERVEAYRSRSCTLSGELSQQQRANVLADFASDEKLFLVATDAAGEGLNLHHHCHRIIHFELPWNPNRLEQRNGRIDRYGQSRPPVIGFLYARDTYEGEVMALLVDKIERQVRRLGCVGDVLGQVQAERIEQILLREGGDLDAAVRQAEQEIDEEIARAENMRLPQLLGDGTVDETETARAVQAVEQGRRQSVDLLDFVQRAVRAAGGRVDNRQNRISIEPPQLWAAGDVERRYVFAAGENTAMVDHEHPLVQAAIRWVKTSRFSVDDDHRLAYVLTPEVEQEDLVVSFIVRVRDGEGQEQERLDAVRVDRDGQVSQDREADLTALGTSGEGNIASDVLADLFSDWWSQAREAAETEAQRRANSWRSSIIGRRVAMQDRFVEELGEWDRASRNAILGDLRDQPTLFGEPTRPPAVRRKLRHHEDRVRERSEFLERRMQFDQPIVEPLGVLLRVPAEGRA